MDAILEITYKNGRERLIDLQTYVTSEPFGASLASEIDLRFDVLDEGLFIEIAHHEPESSSVDSAPTRKAGFDTEVEDCQFEGQKAYLKSDNYIQLLSPEDFKDVGQITRAGQLKIISMGEELVVFSRISALSALYLSEERDMAVLVRVAELASILERQLLLDEPHEDESQEVAEHKRDQAIALEIGVSVALLRKARMFADSLASEEDALDVAGDDDDL